MIIKKYIVEDMKEAMTRAKYELGPEAMILSQRYIKQGKWYNPFKKKRLEVTVALETDAIKSKTIMEEPTKIEYKKRANPVNVDLREEFQDSIMEGASLNVREKLESYCALKALEEDNLSLEDIKEFIEIGFKDNCFDKELDLGRVNVLVGPTGVGKTTTIAKLAAKEHLENNKKVGIVTIDTYKIGAVEQIKIYADILALPFEVVNRPEEMAEAINRLSYCDIILIDTLGTSQKNNDKLNDIKQHIKKIESDVNTYLVLSVSTDKKTLLSILDNYKKLEYDAIILTKFDEATSYENFWNIIENNDYPVEYFCHGQEVPEDIKKATLENLMSYSKEIYRYD